MSGDRLVLASASPRRKLLLERSGYTFVIDPAEIDESIAPHETGLGATARLALEKTLAVAVRHDPDSVVLGADTTVALGDRILGKPVDRDEAVEMLTSLSGRNHRVITSWALAGRAGLDVIGGTTVSCVRMRDIPRSVVRRYVAGGEPLDKAGAYAVQGEGRRFIAAVGGCIDNVIGLPVGQLAPVLGRSGIEPAP